MCPGPGTEPEPAEAPPPRTRREFFARGPAEFAITHDELRRCFRTLTEDPQQIEQAWRTLQIINQPSPESDWPDPEPPDPDVRGF